MTRERIDRSRDFAEIERDGGPAPQLDMASVDQNGRINPSVR